jgi:hypothetical protein
MLHVSVGVVALVRLRIVFWLVGIIILFLIGRRMFLPNARCGSMIGFYVCMLRELCALCLALSCDD